MEHGQGLTRKYLQHKHRYKAAPKEVQRHKMRGGNEGREDCVEERKEAGGDYHYVAGNDGTK